jgi:arylsulfatase
VDGKEVATQKMERTIPFILQFDESLDVGSDTLTGVNDADYQPPFSFTGKINRITLDIDRPRLSPEDTKRLQETARAAGDGPSADATNMSPAETQVSGDIGLSLAQKIDLKMDKLESCRKQADIEKLGALERLGYVRGCMRGATTGQAAGEAK